MRLKREAEKPYLRKPHKQILTSLALLVIVLLVVPFLLIHMSTKVVSDKMDGVLVIIYGSVTIDDSIDGDRVSDVVPYMPPHVKLSDIELCHTDNPDCKWVYDFDYDGNVHRIPNPAFPYRIEKMKKCTVEHEVHKKSIPPYERIDMLRYESF